MEAPADVSRRRGTPPQCRRVQIAARLLPMAIRQSASAVTRQARAMTWGTSGCPNEIVSTLENPAAFLAGGIRLAGADAIERMRHRQADTAAQR